MDPIAAKYNASKVSSGSTGAVRSPSSGFQPANPTFGASSPAGPKYDSKGAHLAIPGGYGLAGTQFNALG